MEKNGKFLKKPKANYFNFYFEDQLSCGLCQTVVRDRHEFYGIILGEIMKVSWNGEKI